MRSIVLSLLRLFSFLFFGSNALEYCNRWTVQIDGHSVEAERLAQKYGFEFQGKVGTCIAYTIIDMAIFNIMDFIFLSPVLDLGPVQTSNFTRAELNSYFSRLK